MKRVTTVTTTELADVFGVTARTVQLWRQAGMPSRVLNDGAPRFVLKECIAWRLDVVRVEERDRERARHTGSDFELRKLAAEAELKEHQLAERRGQLLPIDEARTEIDNFVASFAAVAAGGLTRFERDIVAAQKPADARRITRAMHDALMRGGQEYAARLEAEIAAAEAESETEDAV